MDKLERIKDIEFNDILSRAGFNRAKLTKDYFITLLLCLIRDVDGIYFKGGTAINKIFLNHSRLSEDIDFTLTKDITEVKKEIITLIKKSGLFEEITEDKSVDNFIRLVAHYKGFTGEKGTVFIDLNKRATLLKKSEEYEINHFYFPFIPKFSIKTLAKEEMIAEKLKATITRNKPRDHYDIYMIIKNNLPINVSLTEEKCKGSGEEFSIIRMFNKANKLKCRWDKDMGSLIAKPITFEEVIKFLAKHFNLKEHKEKIKERKRLKKRA